MRVLETFVAAAMLVVAPTAAHAAGAGPAKWLFGAKTDAAAMRPAVYGSYARGCVAGAEKLPDDGETWQAMRPSRNRHWAHPDTIALVKRLSVDGRKVGWNGLMVGDLTQPRGGPMTSGHASHQAGLDADIWLTPMPKRRWSRKEREETSAISMLRRGKEGKLIHQGISKRHFTKAHAGIIETAARYDRVERIFVHPAIKQELCRQNPDRPAWLRKVRSQFGHHYHFHVRLGCPAGSPGCKPQKPVPTYGCDKASLNWWLNVAYGPKKKPKAGANKAGAKKKAAKRKPKRQITLDRLPRQCTGVLTAGGTAGTPPTPLAALLPAAPVKLGANVAVPTFRPLLASGGALPEAVVRDAPRADPIADVLRPRADVGVAAGAVTR